MFGIIESTLGINFHLPDPWSGFATLRGTQAWQASEIYRSSPLSSPKYIICTAVKTWSTHVPLFFSQSWKLVQLQYLWYLKILSNDIRLKAFTILGSLVYKMKYMSMFYSFLCFSLYCFTSAVSSTPTKSPIMRVAIAFIPLPIRMIQFGKILIRLKRRPQLWFFPLSIFNFHSSLCGKTCVNEPERTIVEQTICFKKQS